MKNNKLRVVLVCGVLTVAFTAGAYANSIYKQVTATYRDDINLTYNGQSFEPKEDDGTKIVPLMYNDRTYLPVRAIAEKANLIVDWDGDTNTVMLRDKSADVVVKVEETVVTDNKVVDLSEVGNKLNYMTFSKDKEQFENKYDSGIVHSGSSTSHKSKFELNKKFSTLKCIILNTNSDDGFVEFVSEDGIILKKVYVDRLNKEKRIEVDVRDVESLDMLISGLQVRIAEPKLHTAFVTEEDNLIALKTLRTLQNPLAFSFVDSTQNYMSFSKESSYFKLGEKEYSYGVIHEGSSLTHTSSYMLDSKFTTLKCTLLNMTNDIGRVVFESDDGIIIRDVNLDRLNKEKTIEVDVKNINKLKMTITGQNVRIAEPQLFNKFETKEGNDISLNTLREFKERVSLNNVDSNLDYMVFSKDSNYFEIANEKYKFGIIHGGSSSTHMSEFMLDQKFSRFEATVWSNSSKGKIEILDGDKTLIKTVLLSENNASQKISVDTKGLKNMFIRIYEQETIIAEPMLIQ